MINEDSSGPLLAEIVALRTQMPKPNFPASLQLALRAYEKARDDHRKATSDYTSAIQDAHAKAPGGRANVPTSKMIACEKHQNEAAEARNLAKAALADEISKFAPTFYRECAPYIERVEFLMRECIGLVESSADLLVDLNALCVKNGIEPNRAMKRAVNIKESQRQNLRFFR